MNDKNATQRQSRPATRIVRLRRSALPLVTTTGVVTPQGAPLGWSAWRRREGRRGGR